MGGIVSDNNGSNVQPGWYPSDGQMRYWDGTKWTEHTAPAAPAAPLSGPVAAVNPGGPIGKDERPLWKKKRFIIPAAVVALIVIAAAAGSGGGSGSDDNPTAGDTQSSAPKADAKPSKKADKPEEVAEESADDEPKTDDGTKPSMTLPKQNGDWRLDQFQLKDDGLGSFGAVGRITYTGEDKEGGDNIFTVTVFSKDGETVLASLTGSANSVKPGQTVTATFISSDNYKSGRFPFTFQNDL